MIRFEQLSTLVEEVQGEFAPDPRTSVFEVELKIGAHGITLEGVTSEPAAAEALHRRAALLDLPASVQDTVTCLPYRQDGVATHALVRSAVAPMNATPIISDPQVSHVVLGHHVVILRQRGRWFQCRSEDGYIGWIHRGYLVPMSEVDARSWEIGADGEVCVSLGAEVHSTDGELMVRLPWGARVLRRGEVFLLPDGRTGHASGELIPAAQLPTRFSLNGDDLCATSAGWIGAPYLWGGVTQAGVDCSGFVQVLYRTHGLQLPRDSDQQSRTGESVDPGRDYANLQPGDLLFFAEEGNRVTHVTLSLGGCGIVHSSLGNGGVARNSLLGELEYERELGRIFVCARRVITSVPLSAGAYLEHHSGRVLNEPT